MRRVVLSGAGPSTKPAASAAAEAAWPGQEGSGRMGSASTVTMNFKISLMLLSRHLILTCRFLIAGHQAIRTMALRQYHKFLTSKPPLLKPLRQYCHGLQVLLRFTPAGARPSPPPTSQLPIHTLLAEPAQRVSRGILEILDKLMEDSLCFSHITPEMFAVDQMNGVVKLTETGEKAIVSIDPSYLSHQVDQNCKEIAYLIEDCLFVQNGHDIKQVEELAYGLLPMLRHGGMFMWYAILNHSSLVPILNRLELFVRLYRQVTDIVQVRCPGEYDAIMNNLIFPEDWHSIIEHNSWMLHFYRGGVYNSKEKSRLKQAILFKDYLRNSETHGMERADGKIGRIDLAQIHYALSPMTLHSMQEGLQTYGWLKSTDLDTLFKYRS